MGQKKKKQTEWNHTDTNKKKIALDSESKPM